MSLPASHALVKGLPATLVNVKLIGLKVLRNEVLIVLQYAANKMYVFSVA